MSARDFQKSRLYRWEDTHIGPLDRTPVAFAQLKGMVDAVWQAEGLLYPPAVELFRPKRELRAVGRATRMMVALPAITYGWVMLHELAHAMTVRIDESFDRHLDGVPGHGPDYVGVYCHLLSRYLRIPLDELKRTTAAAGLVVDWDARPRILD